MRFSTFLKSTQAGLSAALLTYGSAIALVYFAARNAGATPEQTASWLICTGLAMGLSSIALSLHYRIPLVTTWSVATAALLAGQSGATLAQALGSIIVCGALIGLCGLSQCTERLLRTLPMPLCAALLAGVLARFAISSFDQLALQPSLLIILLFAYLFFKRVTPRLYILFLWLLGSLSAHWQGLIDWNLAAFSLQTPQWISPEFSAPALLSISLPMFILIMAAQNSAGLTQLRTAAYAVPSRGPIATTGFLQALLAPFGCFSLSIAAASASHCQDDSAHTDPEQRYRAGVAAGVVYLVLGIGGASLALVLNGMPLALLSILAGFALLSTLGNSLTLALRDESWREAALITFAVTTSNAEFLAIGSAFWGLLAGLISALFLRRARA